jgi:hypothetical protein
VPVIAVADVFVAIDRLNVAERTCLVHLWLANRRDETIACELTRPSGLTI